MPSLIEQKREALVRAGELIRPIFHRMRNAISSGDATEYITRLTKKDIVRICQWRYSWKMLYDYLVDKYGLYYINLGPEEKRVYTFKINILNEITAGTTPLLPDETDKFLDRLIAGNSSGDQHGPHAPRRLAGVSSSMALVLAKDYEDALKYLKHLSTLALKAKTGDDVELPILFEADAMFLGEVDGFEQDDNISDDEDEFARAYIDDIVDFGQGDSFVREGDIPGE